MAKNKGPGVKGDERTDTKSAEELRREARHQPEGEPRRDVTDEDVGQDDILRKGIGGYGADDSSVGPRSAPPLSNNSNNNRRE